MSPKAWCNPSTQTSAKVRFIENLQRGNQSCTFFVVNMNKVKIPKVWVMLFRIWKIVFVANDRSFLVKKSEKSFRHFLRFESQLFFFRRFKTNTTGFPFAKFQLIRLLLMFTCSDYTKLLVIFANYTKRKRLTL